MNAGLGNLKSLKLHLLPAGMLAAMDYDDQITAIGKGVASRLEGVCNRYFLRTVDDTHEFPSETAQVILPRFPVETVTKLEQRDSAQAGWYEISGGILNFSQPSGWVYLGGQLGAFGSRLRITYTGGYWWDATEDNSGVRPTGAALLPDDLNLAWMIQCAHLWQSKDRMGAGAAKEPGKFSALKEYDLIPEVKDLLRDYVRFA
jgi:hypothetical protein